MTSLHYFEKITTPTHISVANGKHVHVEGKGQIKLLSENIKSLVLYVPSFPFQLLSIGKVTKTLNCRVIFDSHRVLFQDRATERMIGEGFFFQRLYYFSNNSKHPQISALSSLGQDQVLWHQRLAHPSKNVLTKLMPSLDARNITCDTCHLSKSTRLPFSPSMSRANEMFELVHSDVWGPTIESFNGYKYFVTFVDDFSRVTWIYLLKFKSEVVDVFKDFHTLVMTQFSTKLKILRSDNDIEYMSQKKTQYLAFHDILHQSSCVGTPQQNGVAEHKNRDLLEKTRALIIQMHVPKSFWSQGVLSATYIINRLPIQVLFFKSPLEVLQKQSPDVSHLKVFGCICFVHIQASNHDKLDPRAAKCIFLGYSLTKKGYKCYKYPHSRKLFISRDVQFEETFPYYGEISQQTSSKDIFPLPYPTPADTVSPSTLPPATSNTPHQPLMCPQVQRASVKLFQNLKKIMNTLNSMQILVAVSLCLLQEVLLAQGLLILLWLILRVIP
jgi:hypothetical protein